MGMSASGSHLVFFIGAILAASIMVSMMIGGIRSISTGRREKNDMTQKDMDCRIDIINDPRVAPYNETSDNLTIYVKNTGLKKLEPNELSLFLDGQMVTNFTWEFFQGEAFFNDNIWSTGEVLEYTINITLAEGQHGVKAVLFGRVLSRLDFNIEE